MTARSIVEIDVQDQAFREFKALFDKYNDALADMPAGWGKVAKATEVSVANFGDLLKSAQDTAAATLAIAAGQEKFLKAVGGADRSMASLSRSTAHVARDIKDATLSLIKWTGIVGAVGGLLGAGGIWGIDRLAAGAGGARKSAGGLGISSGDQQAFETNYRRAIDDPASLLGNVADAQNDLGAWEFSALGIKNARQMNTADLSEDVLRRIKKQWDASDHSQQTAEAHGWTRFLSMSDLRRVGGMSWDEFNQLHGRFQSDRNAMSVDPKIQRAWQDLSDQLHRAGIEIGNTFITGLKPLAGPMGHLSTSVNDVAEAFLKSPTLKHWIEDASAGLEHLAKFIGTPQFKQDIDDFVAGVGRIARAIGGAFGWLAARLPNFDSDSGSGAASGGNSLPAAFAFGGQRDWLLKNEPDAFIPSIDRWSGLGTKNFLWDDRTKIAHDYLKSTLGLNDAQTAGLVGGVQGEDNLDPGGINKKSGAQGIGQWTGPRLAQFRAIYGHDPAQGTYAEQVQYIAWELTHTHKNVLDALKRQTTAAGASTVTLQQYEVPETKNNPAEIARRAGLANKLQVQFAKAPPVQITVNNATGGSAVVSGAQVAQ